MFNLAEDMNSCVQRFRFVSDRRRYAEEVFMSASLATSRLFLWEVSLHQVCDHFSIFIITFVQMPLFSIEQESRVPFP